jgi:NADH:ubiquinone oxidoreductase subunit D
VHGPSGFHSRWALVTPRYRKGEAIVTLLAIVRGLEQMGIRVRMPDLLTLGLVGCNSVGCNLSDLVCSLSTMDLVLGSIDTQGRTFNTSTSGP